LQSKGNNFTRKRRIQRPTEAVAVEVHVEVDKSTQRAMELAQEKGASIWLTTLPLQEHNFTLHKGPFRESDTIASRYGWRPNGMAIRYACGNDNSVAHAWSCSRGMS
jgi:hypothetical protein